MKSFVEILAENEKLKRTVVILKGDTSGGLCYKFTPSESEKFLKVASKHKKLNSWVDDIEKSEKYSKTVIVIIDSYTFCLYASFGILRVGYLDSKTSNKVIKKEITPELIIDRFSGKIVIRQI